MSVEISSCMNDESTPQSHSVTTTLRSAPGRGRGGTGGSSPFAMRVVQSAMHARAGVHAPRRHRAGHRAAAHAELRAIDPRFLGRLEAEMIHVAERARDLVAELVAEIAAALDVEDPVRLRRHGRRNAVAGVAGARELIRGRRLQQRQPVVAGIHLRRFGGRARDLRREIQRRVAGAAFDLVGIRRDRSRAPKRCTSPPATAAARSAPRRPSRRS